MYQRGYPFYSMTVIQDSVMSICLTCHVYTSSCHESKETFSTAILCPRLILSESLWFGEMSLRHGPDEMFSTALLYLWSILNAYHISERCPFCQWGSKEGSIEFHHMRALAHTILAASWYSEAKHAFSIEHMKCIVRVTFSKHLVTSRHDMDFGCMYWSQGIIA